MTALLLSDHEIVPCMPRINHSRLSQEDEALPDDVHLLAEVQSLRNRRLLRTLAMVQDLSDALMAVDDVTGKLQAVVVVIKKACMYAFYLYVHLSVICGRSQAAYNRGAPSHSKHHSLKSECINDEQGTEITAFRVVAHKRYCVHHVACDADGKGPVNSSTVLSICGLISAFISVHKNWPSAEPIKKFPGSAFNV